MHARRNIFTLFLIMHSQIKLRQNAFPKSHIGFFLFLLGFFASTPLCAQVTNGDFENGTVTWQQYGQSVLTISPDSHQTANACLIEQRTEYWNGISQNILGDLETGKDYHLKAFVKTTSVPSGLLRFEIKQYDDRGEVSINQGQVLAVDGQWTLLQTGFTPSPSGQLTDLIFVINGHYEDQRKFDFLVDTVSIEENVWRAEADQRIEQHRKRDVELVLTKTTGQPAVGYEIEIQQLSHKFEFASALNDVFMTNQEYADFFKSNFDCGTMEWFSQWKPIETTQGTEDYTIADASVEFAENNGIGIRGHALAWPDPNFMPPWLLDLGAVEVESELTQRIENVVSRFQSRITSWDVGNELLNHTFFKDLLGDPIRATMFQQARQFDPNVELCTNEFGLVRSQDKSRRYREMVELLQTNGAIVDKLGIQGHFEWSVSPKAIEIALAELTPLGLPFRFTEFDFEHPDATKRGEGLTDFYRYAFSRPEVTGITMWGFWAGTHWRGADAALYDLDWNENAAGTSYQNLMSQWTTAATGTTSGTGATEFRGFHGEYLVKSTNPSNGNVNYHLISIAPGAETLELNLLFNNSPAADGGLTVYGTPEDDVFQYDLEKPGIVVLNGNKIRLEKSGIASFDRLRFVGWDGDDELIVNSRVDTQNFNVSDQRLFVIGEPTRVSYDEIESARFLAANPDSTITFLDSDGDDVLVSELEETLLMTPIMNLTGTGFRYVFGRSYAGTDSAIMYDSEEVDRVYCDLTTVSMQAGTNARRAIGFSINYIESSEAADFARIDVGNLEKTIEISPNLVSIQQGEQSFEFSNFLRTFVYAEEDNTDVVNFVGDETDEKISVYPDLTVYQGTGYFVFIDPLFGSLNCETDSLGEDRLLFFDTDGDDHLTINEDTVNILTNGHSHSFNFIDQIWANSSSGGTDTATVTSPNGTVTLTGDWQDP